MLLKSAVSQKNSLMFFQLFVWTLIVFVCMFAGEGPGSPGPDGADRRPLQPRAVLRVPRDHHSATEHQTGVPQTAVGRHQRLRGRCVITLTR